MNNIISSDNGNGTYTNPILYCDYSDPDAIRVGEDYFMVTSSFTDTPGLPVLHSKDLVNWKVVNYCIENVPGESYEVPRYGCGVWAPSIRFHKGIFYVVFPMPDEGIFVTTTRDPFGKWSEPVNILPGGGRIDPCPLWDEDGKCYLVYGVAKSRIGFNNKLFVCELTDDCLNVIGEHIEIYDGEDWGYITTEGPKFYKKDGFYYIFAPAGGVKPGYQLVLRSEKVYGPYDVRLVLKQGGTDINGPHQGAWVDTVTGQDWFIHFQDVYAAGRIVHLQPMTWRDKWPIIGEEILEAGISTGCGQPVITYAKPDVGVKTDICSPDSSDEFVNGNINLAWQWNCNHRQDWILKKQQGIGLKCLYHEGELPYAGNPGILLQKWPAGEFKETFFINAETLNEGDYAGVVAFGLNYGGLLFKKEEKISLFRSQGRISFSAGKPSYEEYYEEKIENCIFDTTDIKVDIVVKRVGTRTGTEGVPMPKEKISFYFNGRFVFDMISEPGRWTGAKTGLFAACKKPESTGFLGVKKVLYEFK